jgi:hypothetical protein
MRVLGSDFPHPAGMGSAIWMSLGAVSTGLEMLLVASDFTSF